MIDIRGSIHHIAQIKSSSTLSLLLDFIFVATRVPCVVEMTEVTFTDSDSTPVLKFLKPDPTPISFQI